VLERKRLASPAMPEAYAVAIRIRAMTVEDVEPAWAASQAAFQALGEHWPPSPAPEAVRTLRGIDRVRHLLEVDPGGSFVAEEDGRVVGVAQALRREGIWGLSLLAVDPGHQSAGLGRALLDAALLYADGTSGQIVLSSSDRRAMRSYAGVGFSIQPAVCAFGTVRRQALPAALGVRPGTRADLELAAEVDRAVRGAAHGPDLRRLIAGGLGFLVAPAGYVVHDGGSPVLLAARVASTAQSLLWAALAEAPPGLEVGVMNLTAGQTWAIPVALEAGLSLEHGGPTFVRGRLGPLTPYLPNPAYL
jgi:predicted N-acetyltransferase YhbS